MFPGKERMQTKNTSVPGDKVQTGVKYKQSEWLEVGVAEEKHWGQGDPKRGEGWVVKTHTHN